MNETTSSTQPPPGSRASKVAIAAGTVAIAAPLLGWIALVAGTHLDVSGLIYAWLALGVLALHAWLLGLACAVTGWAQARRAAASTSLALDGVLLAVIAVASWGLEWGIVVLWAGYEIVHGPFPVDLH